MLNSCEGSHKCDSTAFKVAGVSTNFCLHGLACGGVSGQSFYLSMWSAVSGAGCLECQLVYSSKSLLPVVKLCRGGGGGVLPVLASCCIFTAVFGKGVGALVFVTNVGSAVSFFFFFAMEGNWWSGGNLVTLFMLLKGGESSDWGKPTEICDLFIFLFLMLFIIR